MFELYDSLLSQSDTIDVPNLLQLQQEMNQLDVEGQTYAFALIYYHNHLHHIPVPNITTNPVTVDLQVLPKTLLKILFKFVEMHSVRMQEDKERQLLI